MGFLNEIKKWFLHLFKKVDTNKEDTTFVENKDIVDTELVLEDEKKFDLEFGDIIWARRLNVENAVVGHEEGPFIVCNANNEGITAFYGTGTQPYNFVSKNKVLELNSDLYNLTKKTFFYLSNPNMLSSYIDKMGTLNDSDSLLLRRKLDILKVNGILKDDIQFADVPVMIGDIIKYNNDLYLVMGVSDNKYKVIKVKKNNSASLGNKYEYFYNEVLEIVDTNFTKYDFLHNEVFSKVFSQYLKFEEYKKSSYNFKRGCLVRNNNEYYYIYGEEKDDLLMFKVFLNKLDNEIFINKKRFYTNFDDVRINRKESILSFVDLALDFEMDFISSSRRNFKKKALLDAKKKVVEKKKQKRMKKLPAIGDIIEDKTMAHSKYLVTHVDNCKFTVVDLELLSEGKVRESIFLLNEFRLVRNYDQETLDLIKSCIGSYAELDSLLNKFNYAENTTKEYVKSK